MFKHKKEIFKFSGRSHSLKGIISVIIGSLSLISLLILSIISSLSKGNGGLIIGFIGMLLFVISITGFILGIKACREKEIYYTAPVTGMVINGFLSIFFFVLYMVGVII
ncbi:hypothetical protein Ana3638_10595 [Anaerocolumna sedimenticola]|uniref:Uncharacterized protein n=1 Tax=Anaerocolumna sedimenticola TaxID=2696063 RepID=A0A6P1TJ59_9FIRM|nr:DUF6142 family protein [Anaerocolumna sedimenticola]QHQ61164.1 hypothetical protein Ana3638_10595 [Anaerocolumna sedimenticola]